MKWFEKIPVITPLRGALLYGCVGFLWILFSDQLLLSAELHPRFLTFVQSIKGFVFVGISSALFYGVAKTNAVQLERLNKRVRTGIQQVSLLSRILRHNVRNQCQIIDGYLENIEPTIPDTKQAEAEKIRDATTRLIELSEKSSRLTSELSDGQIPIEQIDVGETVSQVVEDFRARFPMVDFTYSPPAGRAMSYAPRRFDWVLEELLENAIEYNDTHSPRVELSVETNGEGVVLTVEDNGPGLPEVEQLVSENDIETPLTHSAGVGLWVMRIFITLTGGKYDITNKAAGGALITIKLPRFKSIRAENTTYPLRTDS